jgi:Flp pilus assembly protein TadG
MMMRFRALRRSTIAASGLTFLRDTRGAAAFEIAIWATALVVPVFGVADLGFYTYGKMQVEAAAQAAVAAAWKLCDTAGELPAVQNCGGTLVSTMTTAAQNTSLGTAVTLSSASISEGYYCTNSSNQLTLVGTIGSTGSPPVKPSPFTCASVTAGSPAIPGDYLKVTTSYVFTPPYSGLSVTSLLPSPITKTAWMRLN